MNTYDVIVTGGGISGFAAAVAAARSNVKTLLVEQYGFLGGMLTAAGVGPMMSFHAGNVQVVKGITHELIENLTVQGMSPGHIPDTTGYTATVTPFDAEGMKHTMEQMLIESGCDILYHARLLDVTVKENALKHISFHTKNGIVQVQAKLFIDATGDADLAHLCGVPCQLGRLEDNACQPMTMNMKMANVDIEKIKAYIHNSPDEFPRLQKNLHLVDTVPRLSVGGFVRTFAQGKQSGEIDFGRSDILFFETNNPNEVIVNTTRVSDESSTDPWSFSKAEIEGRRQCRLLAQFLTKRIPGFEHAVLLHTGPVQIGVRSSRQIQGRYTLTAHDLLQGTIFPDAIAFGGYPIDIHPPKGGFSDKTIEVFKKHSEQKENHIYSIPYRSLINDTVENLITVGRCISCTFEAQGAIRVTPIAGAIGHGGGAAAAIAVKEDIKASEVNTKTLQALLERQNAYINKNQS